MKTTESDVIEHYDLLIDENNDPVHDPKPLRNHMDKWDGQTFIDKMELTPEKSVLEVGVGTGRLALRTAPFCGKFYGIDFSTKTIERAKVNLRTCDNVTLICDDFYHHTFHVTFDVVYSSLTFMHFEDKQKAVDKIAALLKDDGKFVLSIDKNQDTCINFGTRMIAVSPDRPETILTHIANTGLVSIERYEAEFTHVFIAEKPKKRGLFFKNRKKKAIPLAK